MKTFLSILLLLLVFSQANAQFLGTIDVMDFLHSVGYQDNLREAKNNYAEINGSPYINEDFLPGTVIVNEGKSISQVPLRYNIYTDQVEFKGNNGVTYYIDNPQQFSKIIIGDQDFIYTAYSENKQTLYGYFRVLNEGETQLLERYHIIYKPAEGAKALTDPQPAKFIRTPEEHYLKINEDVVVRVKNGKDIIELLADHNEELAEFMKENKLKTRKEEDLIRLVEFYDKL